MTKAQIMTKLTRTVGKASLKLKKHSPEILVITGVIGAVTSAVMACKATTKVSEILEDTKEQVDSVHELLQLVEEEPERYGERYNVEMSKKDLSIIYFQTGVKFVKLYGPAVVLGAASITSILAGHNILRKRTAAITAAYTAIDKSFKEYRGRVVERFGEELDRELKYNIKAKEIEETIVDKKGKEKTIKKTINVVDPNDISDYARIWYEGNAGWTKNPELNLKFLKDVQKWANQKLKQRGYLFLNDVYEALGFNITQAGNIVGWIYDEEHPNGDNFVDFGIYDKDDPAKIRFVNGDDRSIILDFNVDGPILGLL